MNPNYAVVAERAAHRCEYCRAPEAMFNFPFEVEHVRPRSRQGADDLNNLALACRACNLLKSDRTAARDEFTQAEVELFHPRQDAWNDHFQFDPATAEIHGTSAKGRATVE